MVNWWRTAGEMVTEKELLEAVDAIDDHPKDFYCLYHTKMEQYVAIEGVSMFSMRDLGEKTLLVPDVTREMLNAVASMLEHIGHSIDDIIIVPADYVLRTDFTQSVPARQW
jgi:hypothetical protein